MKSGMKAKGQILREEMTSSERENASHPSGDTKAIGYVGLELRLEISELEIQT